MQEPTKLLSIIIPIYNVAAYISKAAHSVSQQAFPGLEVVLIDDGSTDDSLKICQEILRGVDVVTVTQENMGLSCARNAGLTIASGEYVMFLDADDFLLPSALTNILSALEPDSPDVLFGRYLRFTPKTGLLPGMPYDFNPPSCTMQRTEYILGSLPEPSWNAWRYVCNRRFLLENNLFFEPGILCEDVPWTLTLLETAKTIEFMQAPFYAYFQRRPGSIMSSVNPKRITDLNQILTRLLIRYKDRPVLCRILVWQSFFYINEYANIPNSEKTKVWASYKKTMPHYIQSPSLLHKLMGKCQNRLLFTFTSRSMNLIKNARRWYKYKHIQ